MAFVAPTVNDFTTRFPEFEDTDEDQIQFALDDAGRFVGQNWVSEGDYQAGILFLAAHFLSQGSSGGDSGGGIIASESFGGISVSYAAGKLDSGSLQSTTYGTRFVQLRDLNVRGPMVV